MTGRESQGAQRGRTRRSLIGGALVAGAAGTIATPLRSALAAAGTTSTKPCTPTSPGAPTGAIAVTPDGRTVWTTDARGTTITAHRVRDLRAGRSIDVGGAPAGIAVSPHGDIALVTTAFYDRPGLAIVDLRSGEVDRVDVGAEPGAVVFARDGASAYIVGGGDEGTLTRVDLPSAKVHAPLPLGAHPRGLARSADGRYALVALNGVARLAVVRLGRRPRVAHQIETAAFPAQVAISPDGLRALVTHNGFGARAVSRIDLQRRRVGRPVRVGQDPAGVAFSHSGAVAIVTAAGSGVVTLLDGHSGRRRRIVKPGGAPRAVAVSGRRAVVADAGTGKLTTVSLGARA